MTKNHKKISVFIIFVRKVRCLDIMNYENLSFILKKKFARNNNNNDIRERRDLREIFFIKHFINS